MNDEQETTAAEDDAALAAGFEQTESPTETPGTEARAEPEAVVAAAVEYAQLTKADLEELRARAAEVPNLKATLEKSFGTAFGKIGGIERTLQQLQSGAQVEVSQEDIDALKEDFPPLAAALEKVRSLRAIPGGIDESKIDELVQQRVAPALESIPERVERAVETRLLTKQHPDWREISASPDFNAYAGSLPATEAKQLADSWDSEFIARHIAAFKAKQKAARAADTDASSNRKSRFSAAVTPRGTGTSPATDPNADFLAGFQSG